MRSARSFAESAYLWVGGDAAVSSLAASATYSLGPHSTHHVELAARLCQAADRDVIGNWHWIRNWYRIDGRGRERLRDHGLGSGRPAGPGSMSWIPLHVEHRSARELWAPPFAGRGIRQDVPRGTSEGRPPTARARRGAGVRRPSIRVFHVEHVVDDWRPRRMSLASSGDRRRSGAPMFHLEHVGGARAALDPRRCGHTAALGRGSAPNLKQPSAVPDRDLVPAARGSHGRRLTRDRGRIPAGRPRPREPGRLTGHIPQPSRASELSSPPHAE